MSLTNEEKLELAFQYIKEVSEDIGINLLDNYGYREYTTMQVIRSFLPSIEKVNSERKA